MAFVEELDDEEKGQQGMNVLQGQSPTQQQSQENEQNNQSAPAGSGQGGFIGSGAQQAPQQAPQAASKQSKGSGMFTDLRKYVQANKPKAQEISTAVQKDVQNEAQKTQQALAQKSKSFQDRIAEQRARLGQAQTFAQNQIQNAQQGQQSQDLDRFRNIITGQQQFNVGDTLNTAQAKLDAQRLARQAALSETAQGASNLLNQTFGDNQRYTRGQRSLDELILGGSQDARQGIVTASQQAAQNVQNQLRSARQDAIQGRSNLMDANEALRTNLQQQLGSARDTLQQDVTQEVAQRQQLMREQQDALQNAISQGKVTREMLQPYMSEAAINDPVSAYNAQRQALLMATTRGGYEDLRNRIGGTADYSNINDPFLKDALLNLTKNGQGLDLLDFHDGRLTVSGMNPTFSNARSNLLGVNAENYAPIFDRGASYKDPAFRNEGTGILLKMGATPDQLRQAQYAVQDKYGQELQELEQLKQSTPGMLPGKRHLERNTQADVIQNQINDLKTRMNDEIMQNLTNQIMPEKTSDQFLNEFIQNINRNRSLQGLQLSSPEQIQAGNVITDQQLARQAALSALAGTPGEGIQRVNTQAPSQAAQIDLLNAMRKAGIKGI